jgi:hypothetical protein
VSVVIQRLAQTAARRPGSKVLVFRSGGQPGVGRGVVVARQSQPAARRPQGRVIALTQPIPPPVPTAPIGAALVVQRLAQIAARRPGSKVLAIRSGGRPSTARQVTVTRQSQLASRRPQGRVIVVPQPFAPPAPPPVLPPDSGSGRMYWAQKQRLEREAADLALILSLMD